MAFVWATCATEHGVEKEGRKVHWRLRVRAPAGQFAKALAWMYGSPLEFSHDEMVAWAESGCPLLKLAKDYQIIALETAVCNVISEVVCRGGSELAWALLAVCSKEDLKRELDRCCTQIARQAGHGASTRFLGLLPLRAVNSLLRCRDWIVDSEDDIFAIVELWLDRQREAAERRKIAAEKQSQMQERQQPQSGNAGHKYSDVLKIDAKLIVPGVDPRSGTRAHAQKPRRKLAQPVAKIRPGSSKQLSKRVKTSGLERFKESYEELSGYLSFTMDEMMAATSTWDIRWAEIPIEKIEMLSDIRAVPESLVLDIKEWRSARQVYAYNATKIAEGQRSYLEAEQTLHRSRNLVQSMNEASDKRVQNAMKAQDCAAGFVIVSTNPLPVAGRTSWSAVCGSGWGGRALQITCFADLMGLRRHGARLQVE